MNCKRKGSGGERELNVESLAQAINDARNGAKPAVMHRYSRAPWTVTMLAWNPPPETISEDRLYG